MINYSLISEVDEIKSHLFYLQFPHWVKESNDWKSAPFWFCSSNAISSIIHRSKSLRTFQWKMTGSIPFTILLSSSIKQIQNPNGKPTLLPIPNSSPARIYNWVFTSVLNILIQVWVYCFSRPKLSYYTAMYKITEYQAKWKQTTLSFLFEEKSKVFRKQAFTNMWGGTVCLLQALYPLQKIATIEHSCWSWNIDLPIKHRTILILLLYSNLPLKGIVMEVDQTKAI